jgi:hypothetical protein
MLRDELRTFWQERRLSGEKLAGSSIKFEGASRCKHLEEHHRGLCSFSSTENKDAFELV